MALSGSTVWELQVGGVASDNNGGGFVAGTGTDYTQGAGQKVVSFLAAGGTYTNDLASTSASGWLELTSAAYNAAAADGFTAADVGNIIHISAGTNFTAGWYQIVSVAGNVATLDRACGSVGNATGGSGYLGGPLASPGGLGAILAGTDQCASGMKAYVKGGSYLLSSTSANVSGGKLDLSVSGPTGKSLAVKGYATDAANRDARTGTRPVFDCNGQVATPVVKIAGGSSEPHTVDFIEVDGESLAVDALAGASTTYDRFMYCIARDCDKTQAYTGASAYFCYAVSCAAVGFSSMKCTGCLANGNEVGYYLCDATDCISYSNSQSGYSSSGGMIVNCVAASNTGDGFYEQSSRPSTYVNCISYLDGGYAFNTQTETVLINCAYRNTASGVTNATPYLNLAPVTLAGTPFTNAASLDFSLLATTEGAKCRSTGAGAYLQTGYADIGAVQHADPAASGGACPVITAG